MKISVCRKLAMAFLPVFLSLVCMPAEAQTNLVVNGEFQDGANGTNGWTFLTPPPSYSTPPQSYLYISTNAEDPGFVTIDAPFPGLTVSQALATVPGVYYHVRFSGLFNSQPPTPIPLPAATVDFGGVALPYIYTNKASLQSCDFIVQASQTNTVLTFTCGTTAIWVQTLGHISVMPVTSFDLQPANQTVVLASNAVFTATAIGSVPLSYAWYLNDGLLSGQTGAALALTNVSGTNVGNYRVVMSNASGSITSTVASLSVVLPPHAFTSTITNGNQLSLNLAGNPGQVFAVVAATNLVPPIQWQPVATNSADLNGQWNLVITNRASPRFYRAVGQ